MNNQIKHNKKKVLINVASLGIVQTLNYVFPLISIPIISRIIGPEKFGVINYAASFVGYFVILISYGFDLSATRKISQNSIEPSFINQIFSEVFFAQMYLFMIALVLFCASLYTVSPLTAEKKVAIFTFLTCIATCLSQNWLFQAMQDLPKVAVLSFIGKLLFTIVVLVSVRQKEDYLWQPLIASVCNISIAIISFRWAYKKYRIKLTKPTLQKIISLLWEEKIIFLLTAAVSLYAITNPVILGLYQNSYEVGYYLAGQNLVLIVQTVINIPITQALYPFIGAEFAKSKEDGIKMVRKLFPFVLGITLSATLFLLLLAPYILQLFYGEKFLPSIKVFRILSVMPLLVAIGDLLGIQIMLHLKMEKYVYRITLIVAFFSIFTNMYLSKNYSYTGAAYNRIITDFLIIVLMLILLLSRKINPIDLKEFKLSNIYRLLKQFSGSVFNK